MSIGCKTSAAISAATALILFGAGSEGRAAQRMSCAAARIGQDSICQVGGVTLSYVDWGGRGPPLILLSGLGDTARIYDDLAPRLTADHHVYAFTRRGFGRSELTPGHYGPQDLLGDVVGLMDALGLQRADLLGHSIAGEELSLMGETHPDRVRRLVYLDAAYDRSEASKLELGEGAPSRAPPAAALRSYGALIAWRQAELGVAPSRAVANNVRALFISTPSGLAPRTPPDVPRGILEGDIAAKPRYGDNSAPALAIYASKARPEQLPPGVTAAARAASVKYGLHNIRPWMLREQASFLESKICGVTLELNAGHYMFLEEPGRIASLIESYLAATDPCVWAPDR